MLCGPGAIANAIMLMDDASTFTLKGTLIGIIALVYFITFLILQASTRLVRILGETGNNVMMRLMGLTGESKNHQGDERHDRGPSDNRFPLMLIHAIGHGQENRHRTEWIGQRKKRSET